MSPVPNLCTFCGASASLQAGIFENSTLQAGTLNIPSTCRKRIGTLHTLRPTCRAKSPHSTKIRFSHSGINRLIVLSNVSRTSPVFFSFRSNFEKSSTPDFCPCSRSKFRRFSIDSNLLTLQHLNLGDFEFDLEQVDENVHKPAVAKKTIEV